VVLSVAIAVFGKAEAPMFDAARATLSDVTAPALLGVRAPLVAVGRWFDSMGTMFSVYRENIALRQENAELRKWQDVCAVAGKSAEAV